jgi:hypothetical protein
MSTNTMPSAPTAEMGDPIAEPPPDLHSLEYISAVDAHLTCPICQGPFIAPTQLECEHTFCRQCLTTSYDLSSSRATRPCPMCRRPNSKPVAHGPPRYVTRLLDELRVKCPHQPQGCDAELERAGVETHMERYCEYTLVRCRARGCGLGVIRKDVEQECQHEMRWCEHCDYPLTKQDLQVRGG